MGTSGMFLYPKLTNFQNTSSGDTRPRSERLRGLGQSLAECREPTKDICQQERNSHKEIDKLAREASQ